MQTHPNQKIITIKKPQYTNNFLQIGIADWQRASQLLSPNAFLLYLYLASNANDFKLVLSPILVQNATGMSKSSYNRSISELRELGYMRNIDSHWEFSPNLPE
jgi:hypothetical protein